MQIQTIEQKTSLDRATIRYYEQEGLICPQRLQNGYRDYSEQNLQDLMKVKLFRQLGLSLETISQLMEGKDDLRSVLGNQLVVLKDHKTQVENAEDICKMIIQDNVTYETIKPDKYFSVTSEKQHVDNEIIETPYTEYVYLESHPVRRYIGRYLDQLFTSALLMLIVVVLLRVRPFGDLQNNLLSFAGLFLSMPLNALFLCLLGTTPGKFVVGIYLKTPEGKNMSFLNALKREWAVFRYGMGFNIPIYNLVRLYKSYQIHTDGRELEWDYDYNADVLYTKWDTKRGVFSAVFGIICAITIACSAVASQLPKHRNEDLTLAQFAENYNIYAKQNSMNNYLSFGKRNSTQSYSSLSKEGEWYVAGRRANKTPSLVNGHAVIIDVDPGFTEHWQFITNENQELKQISVNTSSDSRMIIATGISAKISLAVHTAIMSQPDVDISVADEAKRVLSEMVFMSEFGTKEYDFGGVIVNIESKQQSDGISFTVNIIMP